MKRLLTNFKNVIKLVYTQKTKSFIKFLKGNLLFMQNMENPTVFQLSSSDTTRFRRIVLDLLSEACKITDEEYGGIGTLGEKQMHAAIKRFICPDESCHEIKIDGSPLCISQNDSDEDNKKKKRRFVADVMKDGIIYEIQTGSFAPLKEKIKWILDNTSYNLVVIHPIIETKWINYINEKSREVDSRVRSPQKGSYRDLAEELYYVEEFITNPRFSIVLLVMEAEQYKKKSSKKRPKYEKYELIPVSLLRAQVFKSLEDYAIFIPEGLPETFSVKTYSSLSNIRGRNAYSIVKTLVRLGLLEEAGKLGRATAYKLPQK